ncbi:hypothetical protein ACFQ5J_10260 [Lacticaseibacillus baoqingensis]|uniref:DUF304 domain-containing protein n=1 Tax=Lacticaseibacillus baoqingensis TaxID=2486013 RepID=A0ABW4E6X3_9LACO|nr:hypothetical protein [Lacticaseibacillus baoqingensis]
MRRFFYQPAWLDFSIFWGAILAGISAAVIVQMEFGGYDRLFWPAVGGLLVVIVIASLQVASMRMTLTPQALVLGRVFPSNRLIIPYASLHSVAIEGHTLIIDTQVYGKIRLVRMFQMQKLTAACAQAGITVTLRKGKSSIV